MSRDDHGVGAPEVGAGKRFSDNLKSAEKPKRPARFRPMTRVSLAWSPDFAKVRAALNLPPEDADGADSSRDGRSK